MTQERSRKKSTDSKPVAAVEAPNEINDQNQFVSDGSLLNELENKTPNNVKEDIMKQIEQALEENPSQFSVSVVDASPKKVDTLPLEQTNTIIKTFAEKSKTTASLAVAGIAILVQSGGTNASIPPITRVVNGQKFDLKTLRECVTFVAGKQATVRQLAKSMRNIIYKISLQNNWLGPLAIALLKEYPEAKFESLDLIAAAEFHEDNMESYMPPKVREALVDRANKLRAAKLQPKKTKPRRKGGKNKNR